MPTPRYDPLAWPFVGLTSELSILLYMPLTDSTETFERGQYLVTVYSLGYVNAAIAP